MITLPFHRFRCIFCWPKSIQASVTLLENLHIILEKTPKDEIQSDVMPILYTALENSTAQIQVWRTALCAINVHVHVHLLGFVHSVGVMKPVKKYIHACIEKIKTGIL